MNVQQQNGEKPPSYSEAVTDHDQRMINNNQAMVGYSQGMTNHNQEMANNDQAVVAHGQNATVVEVQVTKVQITMINYLRHPRRFVGKQNASNSFKGLLDVMYDEKKLPWSFAKKIIYKVALFIYYLVNFIYSVAAIAVQGEHIAFHLAYLFISLIGLAYEITDVLIDTRKLMIQCKRNRVANMEDQPRQGWTGGEDDMTLATVEDNEQNAAQDDNSYSSQWTQEEIEELTYKKKAKIVFTDYIIHSLGEILIYPTFICVLYGFINEKAWQFNNGISAFYFLLLLYSVAMDAVYAKFYVIWLLIRVVRASFTKYDELQSQKLECSRFFTPVYLTIPFAVLVAIVHWLMLGIIGVRIYVDNFTPDYDTDGKVPSTGDYKVANFTFYMIFCAVYLPIASWVVYIRLNKFWFYEVYSLINQFSANEADYIWTLPSSMKLTAFLVDPVSYFAVIFLMVPFIVFTVATYLPDYDGSDFEVASSARSAMQGLGPCFVIFFLLANLQASIIFTILVVIIISILIYILITVCAVANCIDDTVNCR